MLQEYWKILIDSFYWSQVIKISCPKLHCPLNDRSPMLMVYHKRNAKRKGKMYGLICEPVAGLRFTFTSVIVACYSSCLMYGKFLTSVCVYFLLWKGFFCITTFLSSPPQIFNRNNSSTVYTYYDWSNWRVKWNWWLHQISFLDKRVLHYKWI